MKLLLSIFFCVITSLCYSQLVRIDSVYDTNKLVQIKFPNATRIKTSKDSICMCCKPNTSKVAAPLIMVNNRRVKGDKINKINPDDIDSISILKDEKAIKRYGHKAKNGVIIIKLKKKIITAQ